MCQNLDNQWCRNLSTDSFRYNFFLFLQSYTPSPLHLFDKYSEITCLYFAGYALAETKLDNGLLILKGGDWNQ